MADQVGGLLSIFADQPHLPGALCTDVPRVFDWELMDDEVEPRNVRAQRHEQAIEICSVCPAFARCEEWATTLETGEVPGVIAGQIRPPKGIKFRRTAA